MPSQKRGNQNKNKNSGYKNKVLKAIINMEEGVPMKIQFKFTNLLYEF